MKDAAEIHVVAYRMEHQWRDSAQAAVDSTAQIIVAADVRTVQILFISEVRDSVMNRSTAPIPSARWACRPESAARRRLRLCLPGGPAR